MAGVDGIEVVVAHRERATLRVGDVFLKIDTDGTRTDREVEAMALAPIPTPRVLWRRDPVLALAALPGTALGRLGHPSTASSARWATVGSVLRTLHDAPAPPWQSSRSNQSPEGLDRECDRLVRDGILPDTLVARNRLVADAAFRPSAPVFIHGDLQVSHVFLQDDQITGVLDWSEAGQGDAAYDLAILTLGQEERLADVVTGYGRDIDLDAVRGYWSMRSLLAIRWLLDNGFDPFAPGCEVDVLKARM
jgi:aminoglycoside phosphotransferase (APT) family kinase protein